MRPKRSVSLAAKLPLALAVLLSLVVVAMAVAGYLEVRRTSATNAVVQVDNAARQLADLFATATRARMTVVQTLAQDPQVAGYLARPVPDAMAPVVDRLKAARTTGQTAANAANTEVELWDSARKRIAMEGVALPERSAADAAALVALVASQPAAISPFAVVDGRGMYAVIAPVGAGPTPAGYVVEHHVIVVTQQPSQQVALLSRLVAANARLLLGNMAGDYWNDFGRQVPGPTREQLSAQLPSYTREDGTAVYARAAPIQNTPWAVAIEFPQTAVLEPVHRYVRRSWILALVVALIGAAIGWVLSRRVTTPLQKMTRAAEEIAAGHSTERIGLRRGDELGRLATAFDSMSEHVERGRRDLEARVESRTAELNAANRELEAFSYSVSHDLRAPLRAINGFSRILLEDHAGNLNEEGQHYLRRVSQNAGMMGQLIDDLLAFSRLSRHQLTRTRIDMTALFLAVIGDCERAEPERRIEFVQHPLPPAWGDPSLIKQVVVNFVHNAVKFTRRTEGARIEVGATAGNGGTIYYVRDNGVGFDMRYADKLFGVFQRLHKAEDFEGTGVGLAIVQRVVTRHGGKAWAESELGKGATFYFSLPEDGA
jgi:signal transduction histidine kinase